MGDVENAGYWDSYYAARAGQHTVPSQFAAFLQGELSARSLIIDVGCGTGRDTLFFSSLGHEVVGVDEAGAAISSCEATAHQRGLQAKFVRSSVNAPDFADILRGMRETDAQLTIYARFFLHAIDDAAEAAFLKACREICRPGDGLAFEFRTVRDASLSKVTPEHYRRYLEPTKLLASLHALGFETDYYVEGFGFAKYKSDDAYVARVLAHLR